MFINTFIERTKEFNRTEIISLVLILIIAFVLNFYHHFHYPYLFHVDEWFHVAQAKQIVLGSQIDWYNGQIFSLGMEKAWHLMLALVYFVFKPTIPQWIYLPSLLHLISIIVVYLFVSKLYRKLEALVASFLIALIPSNVTMGGPVLLIPTNLALIFIPLALLFAFKLTKLKLMYNYLFLFIIAIFLLYAHPPTAVVLIIILGFYFLLNIFSKNQDDKRHATRIFITLFLSILMAIPNYASSLTQRGSETFTFDFWVHLQGIPIIFGLIPTLFFIVGFYFLSKKDNKENWCLILTSIILLINLLIFTIFGTNYILPYSRTHIPLLLIMSIIAGFGYIRFLNIFHFTRKSRLILLVLLLTITAIIAIPRNLDTNYYHIIDDEDYNNFLWIKQNTNDDIIVLCDPWKARALAPIAERRVYAVLPFGPHEKPMKLVTEANRFFQQDCSNTSFLIEHDITIIYTRGTCQNTDLIQIYNYTYELR